MSKSDYLENEILDHILGAATWTAPATIHVALFTAAPSDSGGGTEVSTGVWTNYSRSAVTNNATNWPAASGGSKSNGTAISFGTAAITGTAPVVTHFALMDASSAGNILYWGALTDAQTINNTNPVSFPISSITITEG
jgi:hypothetical protein